MKESFAGFLQQQDALGQAASRLAIEESLRIKDEALNNAVKTEAEIQEANNRLGDFRNSILSVFFDEVIPTLPGGLVCRTYISEYAGMGSSKKPLELQYNDHGEVDYPKGVRISHNTIKIAWGTFNDSAQPPKRKFLPGVVDYSGPDFVDIASYQQFYLSVSRGRIAVGGRNDMVIPENAVQPIDRDRFEVQIPEEDVWDHPELVYPVFAFGIKNAAQSGEFWQKASTLKRNSRAGERPMPHFIYSEEDLSRKSAYDALTRYQVRDGSGRYILRYGTKQYEETWEEYVYRRGKKVDPPWATSSGSSWSADPPKTYSVTVSSDSPIKISRGK